MPQARAAYDKGVPLRVLIRRLQLSRSEAQDLAPEEFEAHDEDRNPMTGY